MRAAIAAESKEEEAKAQKAKEAAAWIAHKTGDGQVSHAPSASSCAVLSRCHCSASRAYNAAACTEEAPVGGEVSNTRWDACCALSCRQRCHIFQHQVHMKLR